jgi:hypothetical protein
VHDLYLEEEEADQGCKEYLQVVLCVTGRERLAA